MGIPFGHRLLLDSMSFKRRPSCGCVVDREDVGGSLSSTAASSCAAKSTPGPVAYPVPTVGANFGIENIAG